MKVRKDLMVLSEDDLVLLTNRGTVKRALRELDESEVTVEIRCDQDENLSFICSDGAVSHFPAQATVYGATCSCAASVTCRHIIRSVLAYQRFGTDSAGHVAQEFAVADEAEKAAAAAAQVAAQAGAGRLAKVWNPGSISDEVLQKSVKPQVLKQARRMFNEEHVIELVTGVKPLARFHTAAATVRFLVEADPRYTHCSCPDEPPCLHVPVAVWAFRKSSDGAAVVSTQSGAYQVSSVVDMVEALLAELVRFGISGMTAMSVHSFHRAIQACEEDELFWSAELLQELLDERDKYHRGDARFSSERVVEIIGELIARHDALRSKTGSVPRPFITGMRESPAATSSSLQLIGLGCGVSLRRRISTFTAYFQDPSSATLTGIARQFVEPADSYPASFHDHAHSKFIKGYSLADLAAGQVLAKGGKLSAARMYRPGRAQLIVNPQSYDWQTSLKAPVLVENFSELRSMLSIKPPSYLAPRQLGQRFHVVAIEKILEARFRESLQALVARVIDKSGNEAKLFHAFDENGAAGFEALSAVLSDSAVDCRLIAGDFRQTAQGLVVKPVSLIVEERGMRRMVQPYIDLPEKLSPVPGANQPHVRPCDPLGLFLQEFADALGQLVVTGAQRSGEQTSRHWAHLETRAASLGFSWLHREIARLAPALYTKESRQDGQMNDAVACVLSLCLIFEVAREENRDSNEGHV